MADEDKTPESTDPTPEAEQTPAQETPAPQAKEKAPKKTAPEADKADAPKAEAADKADAPADAEGTEPSEAPVAPPEPEPEPKRSIPAPPLPDGTHYIWGTGRRKAAIARVRIRPGTGQILINKRDKDAYFVHDADRAAVVAPLVAVDMNASWDIWANVSGGGSTGQADAVKLGLARALSRAAPDTEHALRDKGLLTRDPRMPERKKPGQPGARKRFQFSKR